MWINNPAVTYTQNTFEYFGDGKEIKEKRGKYERRRQKLQKNKKIKKIKKSKNKEQNFMKDQDHKISRSIVNKAKEDKVKIIVMEDLTNIRNNLKRWGGG